MCHVLMGPLSSDTRLEAKSHVLLCLRRPSWHKLSLWQWILVQGHLPNISRQSLRFIVILAIIVSENDLDRGGCGRYGIIAAANI